LSPNEEDLQGDWCATWYRDPGRIVDESEEGARSREGFAVAAGVGAKSSAGTWKDFLVCDTHLSVDAWERSLGDVQGVQLALELMWKGSL